MHDSLDPARAPRRGTTPLLDAAMIAELRELDEGEDGLLTELVDMFCEETTRRVSELREALEQGDTGAAERIAHAMKSAAANIGAKSLSAHWQQLESDARAGAPTEGLRDRFQQCLESYEASTRALDALLGRR